MEVGSLVVWWMVDGSLVDGWLVVGGRSFGASSLVAGVGRTEVGSLVVGRSVGREVGSLVA